MIFRLYTRDEIKAMPLEQLDRALAENLRAIQILDFAIVFLSAWVICKVLP